MIFEAKGINMESQSEDTEEYDPRYIIRNTLRNCKDFPQELLGKRTRYKESKKTITNMLNKICPGFLESLTKTEENTSTISGQKPTQFDEKGNLKLPLKKIDPKKAGESKYTRNNGDEIPQIVTFENTENSSELTKKHFITDRVKRTRFTYEDFSD